MILHGAKDMGWSDQFARSLAQEYKSKVDFMSVVDDEGKDPQTAKNTIANLGAYSQTYGNRRSDLRHRFRLTRYFN